jgi:hypothetical protein
MLVCHILNLRRGRRRKQQIPPASLRSRVGMTRNEEFGRRNDKGCGAAIATFEGSTFVGMGAVFASAIVLTGGVTECNHLAIADVADYAPSDRRSEGAFAFWAFTG